MNKPNSVSMAFYFHASLRHIRRRDVDDFLDTVVEGDDVHFTVARAIHFFCGEDSYWDRVPKVDRIGFVIHIFEELCPGFRQTTQCLIDLKQLLDSRASVQQIHAWTLSNSN